MASMPKAMRPTMAPTTTEVVRAARWRCGGVVGVVSGMAAAWQRTAGAT